MAHQPSGSAQKGCICLPYTAPELSAGLSLLKPASGRGKGEHALKEMTYTGSTWKLLTMLYSSFVSSLRRISSSTHRKTFP